MGICDDCGVRVSRYLPVICHPPPPYLVASANNQQQPTRTRQLPVYLLYKLSVAPTPHCILTNSPRTGTNSPLRFARRPFNKNNSTPLFARARPSQSSGQGSRFGWRLRALPSRRPSATPANSKVKAAFFPPARQSFPFPTSICLSSEAAPFSSRNFF